MTAPLHHTDSPAPADVAKASSPFFDQYWSKSTDFETFLGTVEDKVDLWHSYAKRAKLHADDLQRVTDLPAARKIIVITEDWCGDAIRSVPTVVAMGEAATNVEVRVLDADNYPESMDDRLTKGARAIPIVIVFDENGHELGAWGPRPAPLQAELRAKLHSEGRPTDETKAEYYAPIMGWYAKDKGRTVAQEILMLLERD